LRDDVEALTAAIQRAAEHFGIIDAFIEKDFWVTEVLRSVASGATVTVAGVETPVTAVFKGGTSLSRVFRLTERFSEDVDILIAFPEGASQGSRDRALKHIVERCHEHLGPAVTAETVTSTKGVKRNVEFAYPRQFVNPIVREAVLLEMGSRGGPEPHESRTLHSMLAEYAAEVLGEGAETWEEFAPVTIATLNPERTLLEKCALLHNLAVRFDEGDETAMEYMGRAGRHYYDLRCLLSNDGVRAALAAMGPEGVVTLVGDINAQSAKAGWRFVARPDAGFGASPAFDPSAKCQLAAERSYGVALGMVHGTQPSLADCLTVIKANAHLL
jgi:hypothetical protein